MGCIGREVQKLKYKFELKKTVPDSGDLGVLEWLNGFDF